MVLRRFRSPLRLKMVATIFFGQFFVPPLDNGFHLYPCKRLHISAGWRIDLQISFAK
jgi:hypothetical protein